MYLNLLANAWDQLPGKELAVAEPEAQTAAATPQGECVPWRVYVPKRGFDWVLVPLVLSVA
ncbi:hypothetical protein [Actinobaculum sp. 352]|uniref:hypothetical protein n=1 Tax=Actinobaculum sp. 352 TaxID=2490946 RepID=UPI000FB97380|nr:hypothetical protein [Actinobaculum sp. 352]RTE48535.1 hypothetical protein EKN07_09210 [Actinobaculum sp. 352]